MVGLLAGALGSGIGQAAGGVAEIAKGYIDDERKVDLQRQFADIEMEKQNRLDELKTDRKYKDDVRRTDPNGDLVANELQNSNLKARQDAKNTVDKIGTSGYLESLTKEDMAKSAGERSVKGMPSGENASERDYRNAQTDAARIKNENDREIATLRKEAAQKDTTPERKAEIKNTIEILTGKDSDNYGHYTDQETGKTVIYNKKDGLIAGQQSAAATPAPNVNRPPLSSYQTKPAK